MYTSTIMGGEILMDREDLRFELNSIIPAFSDSGWTISDGSIDGVNNKLTLNVNGYAYIEIEDSVVNKSFDYYKIYIKYKNDSITHMNNFKSGPSIQLDETYKDSNNDISDNITRCVGFNNFEVIDQLNNIYSDTTIVSALKKKIVRLYVIIRNTSNSVLYIDNFGMYGSIDISDEQVSGVVNNIISSTEPSGFKVYFTDDTMSMLSGLGVLMGNQGDELKYKPLYLDGLLARIETNFGISYDVTNITSPIDLDQED